MKGYQPSNKKPPVSKELNKALDTISKLPAAKRIASDRASETLGDKPVPDTRLDEVRASVSKSTHVAIAEATAVTITDPDSYAAADLILFKIRAARKIVADKMDPIIGPIRKGLDALYALRRELDNPFDAAELKVKGAMAGWQAKERKRVEDERQAQIREQARLRHEQEEAERQAARATTANARIVAQAKAFEARQAADAVKEREIVGPTQAVGSSVRVQKKVRVKDLTALIAGVVAGDVPEIVLTVNQEVLDTYFEQDRGIVGMWPGVEMYETTVIAWRRAT